ncbi:alpha/beta hydrolase [Caldicellulosiruptor danielii]|uniref:Alpha/beta hydrolase n=2 Tax=Anaerocellum danielii TaxID=1387557 RepID=A0ABZ0TYZ1_9FIRM|nr:alpha/beta hydrolase [Caldicellulosiruptor danielii]WPX08437.1 alpha/beta hydrolase [Caldicellulosiruptor danielii]
MEPHFIFVKLSRLLEQYGIASVRFDFAGSGESDGEFYDMTVTREIDDARCILEYLFSLDFVDKQKISIIGLSLGGAISSYLAGEYKEKLYKVVLWAPAGNMKEIAKNVVESDPTIKEKGYIDLGGLLLSQDFYYDLQKYDFFEEIKRYPGKVLILHGTNDQAVPIEVGRKYKQILGDRAELIEIEGADHTFNKYEWERLVLDKTVEFLKD